MYNIERMRGITALYSLKGRPDGFTPSVKTIEECERMYDEFENSTYNMPARTLNACINEWFYAKNRDGHQYE